MCTRCTRPSTTSFDHRPKLPTKEMCVFGSLSSLWWGHVQYLGCASPYRADVPPCVCSAVFNGVSCMTWREKKQDLNKCLLMKSLFFHPAILWQPLPRPKSLYLGRYAYLRQSLSDGLLTSSRSRLLIARSVRKNKHSVVKVRHLILFTFSRSRGTTILIPQITVLPPSFVHTCRLCNVFFGTTGPSQLLAPPDRYRAPVFNLCHTVVYTVDIIAHPWFHHIHDHV